MARDGLAGRRPVGRRPVGRVRAGGAAAGPAKYPGQSSLSEAVIQFQRLARISFRSWEGLVVGHQIPRAKDNVRFGYAEVASREVGVFLNRLLEVLERLFPLTSP